MKGIPPPSPRFRALRTAALGAVGIVLAWFVLSGSLAAYLAGSAPQAALWLAPGDPEALLTLAERRLEPARTMDAAGDANERSTAEASPLAAAAHDEARRWVETALAHDPLNARALRVLGSLAHAAGDADRAARYMRAAVDRSVHQSLAVHWLMENAYERRDYAAALRFADTLLRTRRRSLPHVLRVMGAIAENPQAKGELEKLLAANPPWRRAFFSALPRAVSDARTPLSFLLAARKAPDPPTLADIRDYVNLLVRHQLYELAYYTWLQFLPTEQLAHAGFLFNGSFEQAPSGLPFDWMMRGGKGATVDIGPRPDRPERRALFVELGPGRVELGGAAQVLLLAPGTYRLKGRYRGKLDGPRGLVWRISCAGRRGPPLGESAMMIGVAAPWKEVAFSFTVPDADCRAQQLRLLLDARMPSEQLVSGSIWLDDLRLSRE